MKENIFFENALKLKKENERIDDLQIDDRYIIQAKDGYCFTSDSVLLANFCKTSGSLLELCAGSGVISILVNEKNNLKSITAIEVQNPLFDLCKRNFELNELINAKVYNDDLKNYKQWFDGKTYDCVVCNPPYEKLSTSFLKEKDEIKIARSEVLATFNDIANTVSHTLKFGGSFYFLNKAERLSECFEILKKNKIEPKLLQMIHEKHNSPARLFLCKAVLGGKSGLEILAPIIRCNDDGTESEQIKNIYNRKIK